MGLLKFRADHPEYNVLTDSELMDALHEKYGKPIGLSFYEHSKLMGYSTPTGDETEKYFRMRSDSQPKIIKESTIPKKQEEPIRQSLAEQEDWGAYGQLIKGAGRSVTQGIRDLALFENARAEQERNVRLKSLGPNAPQEMRDKIEAEYLQDSSRAKEVYDWLPAYNPEIHKGFKTGAMSMIEDAVHGLARFAPAMALTPISPEAGYLVSHALIAGGEYNKYKSKGYDDNLAWEASNLSASLQAPIETATTAFQMDKIIGIFTKNFKGAFKTRLLSILQNSLAEGLEEYTQAHGEAIADEWAKDPNQSDSQLLANVWAHWKDPEFQKDAAYQFAVGAIGGALLPTTSIAVRAPFDAAMKIKNDFVDSVAKSNYTVDELNKADNIQKELDKLSSSLGKAPEELRNEFKKEKERLDKTYGTKTPEQEKELVDQVKKTVKQDKKKAEEPKEVPTESKPISFIGRQSDNQPFKTKAAAVSALKRNKKLDENIYEIYQNPEGEGFYITLKEGAEPETVKPETYDQWQTQVRDFKQFAQKVFAREKDEAEPALDPITEKELTAPALRKQMISEGKDPNTDKYELEFSKRRGYSDKEILEFASMKKKYRKLLEQAKLMGIPKEQAEYDLYLRPDEEITETEAQDLIAKSADKSAIKLGDIMYAIEYGTTPEDIANKIELLQARRSTLTRENDRVAINAQIKEAIKVRELLLIGEQIKQGKWKYQWLYDAVKDRSNNLDIQIGRADYNDTLQKLTTPTQRARYNYSRGRAIWRSREKNNWIFLNPQNLRDDYTAGHTESTLVHELLHSYVFATLGGLHTQQSRSLENSLRIWWEEIPKENKLYLETIANMRGNKDFSDYDNWLAYTTGSFLAALKNGVYHEAYTYAFSSPPLMVELAKIETPASEKLGAPAESAWARLIRYVIESLRDIFVSKPHNALKDLLDIMNYHVEGLSVGYMKIVADEYGFDPVTYDILEEEKPVVLRKRGNEITRINSDWNSALGKTHAEATKKKQLTEADKELLRARKEARGGKSVTEYNIEQALERQRKHRKQQAVKRKVELEPKVVRERQRRHPATQLDFMNTKQLLQEWSNLASEITIGKKKGIKERGYYEWRDTRIQIIKNLLHAKEPDPYTSRERTQADRDAEESSRLKVAYRTAKNEITQLTAKERLSKEGRALQKRVNELSKRLIELGQKDEVDLSLIKEAPKPTEPTPKRADIIDANSESNKLAAKIQDVFNALTGKLQKNETVSHEHYTKIKKLFKNGLDKEILNVDDYEVAMSVLDQARPLDMLEEITAWHGGAKFDRFSTEFIGTGEGNQAFGWGLYFSERKHVGQYYKKQYQRKYNQAFKKVVDENKAKELYSRLSPEAKRVVSNMFDYYDVDNYWDEGFKLETPYQEILHTIYYIIKHADPADYKGAFTPEIEAGIEDNIQEFKKIFKDVPNLFSSLYKVKLHHGKSPNEYMYLDWNKPISEELNQQINAQLKKENLFDIIGPAKYNNARGMDLYNDLASYMGEKEASLFLLRSGIDGIKYRIGSTFGYNTEENNYVVFDPDAANIYIEAMEDRIPEERFNNEATKEQAKKILDEFVPGHNWYIEGYYPKGSGYAGTGWAFHALNEDSPVFGTTILVPNLMDKSAIEAKIQARIDHFNKYRKSTVDKNNVVNIKPLRKKQLTKEIKWGKEYQVQNAVDPFTEEKLTHLKINSVGDKQTRIQKITNTVYAHVKSKPHKLQKGEYSRNKKVGDIVWPGETYRFVETKDVTLSPYWVEGKKENSNKFEEISGFNSFEEAQAFIAQYIYDDSFAEELTPRDVETPDPELERMYKENSGGVHDNFWENTKKFLKDVWDQRREFTGVTWKEKGFYAEATKTIRHLFKQRGVSAMKAVKHLSKILDGLSKPQYEALEKFSFYMDLYEQVEINRDLPEDQRLAHPFGLTDEQVENEAARLYGIVYSDEKLRDAWTKRLEAWHSIREDYIEAMENAGYNVRDKLKRQFYFRHQVLDYLTAQQRSYGVKGSGGKLALPTKRSHLKQRKGGTWGINLNYIQAEYEVMTQLIYDTEIATALSHIMDTYGVREPREGYVEYIPRPEGNVLYLANTIPANIARGLIEGNLQQFNIKPNHLRKVLAIGNKYEGYYIPEKLDTILHNTIKKRPESVFAKTLFTLQNAWKQWQLLNPFRLVKYNLRNITGDAEAVFVGNPAVFAKLPQALMEVVRWKRGKLISPLMDKWLELGGQETLLQAQEISKIIEHPNFKKFEKKGKLPNLNVISHWMKAARSSTDMREAWLRFAAFIHYIEQIERGRPLNYGGSFREEVDAIQDTYDKAFMLSNDLLGAYDRISQGGEFLRRYVFPFWSFQEINMDRSVQFFRNAMKDDRLLGAIGRSVGAKSAIAAIKLGKLAVKFVMLSSLVTLWNNWRFPDEEKALPDELRRRIHVIMSVNDKDGSPEVIYFPRIGILGDLLEWGGMDKSINDTWDIIAGRRQFKNIVRDYTQWNSDDIRESIRNNTITNTIANKVLQGISPHYKLPMEMILNIRLFPDIFKPSPIGNMAEYIGQQVGVGEFVSKIIDAPQPKDWLSKKFWSAVTYKADVNRMGYIHILEKKDEFLHRYGLKGSGFTRSENSNLLYEIGLAWRYGDMQAFAKAYGDYLVATAKRGQTPQDIDDVWKKIDPLNGIPKHSGWRKRFLMNLEPYDYYALKLAYKYYDELRSGMQFSKEQK